MLEIPLSGVSCRRMVNRYITSQKARQGLMGLCDCLLCHGFTMKSKDSFRNILNQALKLRAERNPRYSLRAFARDLGLSASRLSEIINGGHLPTVETARQIAKSLKFDRTRATYFCNLVRREHCHNRQELKEIDKSIAAYQKTTSSYNRLKSDSFRVIQDWHHLAIVELLSLERFENAGPDDIARELGLEIRTTKDAINRLLRVGMIKRDPENKFIITAKNNLVSFDIPSASIRSFHKQTLGRAISALDLQPITDREFQSTFVAIPRSALPRLRQKIEQWVDDMVGEARSAYPKEELYCLSVQFFGLKQPPHQSTSMYP